MSKAVFIIILVCSVLSGGASAQESGGYDGIHKGKPQINTPRVIGNYPSSPFLYYVPVSGERTVDCSVERLPPGLTFDAETGIISGTVQKAGDYKVKVKAKNQLGSVAKELTISIGDRLALTPPMGWNSWNTFGRSLNESLIIETAEAMIKNGMRDVGYTYINIDDFWQLAERGEDGHIQIDREKFPNGIKYVADYLHKRGFKLGIYSDAADRTCGGVCGSFGYEETDAADFAEWGIDLLKYDYCNAPDDKQTAIERYTAMGKALRATKRSIIFSICEWGGREPWLWAREAGGHYWRTTFDIRDRWQVENYSYMENGVMNILDLNERLSQYAGTGGWNDPDMLIVGISGTSRTMNTGEEDVVGCTPEQYRSHMSLWAMMAAPLLSGNDVRHMDPVTLTTLTNPEIIAINQDALGKQGVRKIKNETFQIWEKELTNGRKAVAFLNTTDSNMKIPLNKETEPYLTSKKNIRDVWEHKNLKIDNQPVEKGINLLPYQCKVYILK
ncbi:putative Ig domain-containing protein [Dysgonomonas sp. GY75]|uniref:putative Ig domain-containing protein n=1 Tax=Dysgonomonas sp. GY75 TaxID=2780419 RepID=UPI001883676A|nr:putative Ig domain-containing protein [Dysgonomonas sp. GY75]MBF0648642.1 putative Ig domain-containing protein [Dysgonomonas sp. GY75]